MSVVEGVAAVHNNDGVAPHFDLWGAQAPIQHDVADAPAIAIHRDTIDGPLHGVERESGSAHPRSRRCRDRVRPSPNARVRRQQGVEVAAEGVHHHAAAEGALPRHQTDLPPGLPA